MITQEFVQLGMNVKSLPLDSDDVAAKLAFAPIAEDIPLTVRQAAAFLGVSPQTVYLWVERKQIPHLRVMGRNIRFLKSELEPFRAQFKQEVVNWQDQ
jgi:excisionase family DNA binding protein